MFILKSRMLVLLFLAFLLMPEKANSMERELNYAGMASRDKSAMQSSGSGASGGSVSLYTGQHVEEFPLLVIPAKGLGDILISLSYYGNVNYITSKENREAPAPWVGLGFGMGFESILSNHKSSVLIDDDIYYFVGAGGGTFEFIFSDTSQGNRVFVPSDGRPWKIVQHTDTANGYEYVVGWEITKDDGILYRYGDFSYVGDSIKATKYLLHWGNYVGVGGAGSDHRFPYQWDLSRVERGNNHWIQYSYTHKEQKIVVPYGTNLTTNSYTRSSFPLRIRTSTGYMAEFILGDRLDYQSFQNGIDYEFYSDNRLDSIYLYKGAKIISRTALVYNYLNLGADSTRKKLILKRIVPYDSSGNTSLPATVFSYYVHDTLDYYGSIKSIAYPTGAIKEISYAEVPADSIYTELHGRQNRSYQGVTSNAFSRNVMISKFKAVGETEWQYELAAWNGFWDKRLLQDITDDVQDSAIVAGDNWVALYNHSSNIFLHFKWQSGNWVRDTIPMTWTPEHLIELHAGNDFIVALDIDYAGFETYTRKIKRAYFYKRTSGQRGWEELLMFDLGNYSKKFAGIQLGQDLYAIKIDSNLVPTQQKLFYGKYHQTESPFLQGTLTTGETGWLPYEMEYTVGSDFVAWQGLNQVDCLPPPCLYDGGIGVAEFDGQVFVDGRLQDWRVGPPIDSAILINTGSSVIQVSKNGNSVRYWLRTDTAGIWEFGGNLNAGIGYDASYPIRIFPSGSNAFGLWYKNSSTSNFDFSIFQWNGQSFQKFTPLSSMGTGNPSGALAYMTSEICAIYNEYNQALWVSRRIDATNWETPATLLLQPIQYHVSGNQYSPARFSAAKDRVIVTGNTLTAHDPWRWAFFYNRENGLWQGSGINAYTDPGSIEKFATPIVYGDRAFVQVKNEDMSFFQFHGLEFTEKPTINVVDNTKFYNYSANGEDTIVVEYQYNGGILDESANTPRFTKVKRFVPRFASESSKSFTLFRYHNDMSASDSNFMQLDTLIGLPDYNLICWECTQWAIDTTVNPPDTLSCLNYELGGPPCDSTSIDTIITGITEYMLDGLEYLRVEHDSAAQENGSEFLDSAWSYYASFDLNVDPYQRYRTYLDSTHIIKDQLPLDRKYIYNLENGRNRIKKTYRASLDDVIIDSIHYAYESDQNIEDDNYLSLIDETWQIRDSAGARTTLSRSSTKYTKEVFWQKALAKTYPDLDDTTKSIITFQPLPVGGYDSLGNLLSWTNANGDTSCVKFDSAGTYAIASASNCYPRDFFIQDFEQGDGWDGWRTKTWQTHVSLFSGNSVFTGNFSYRLIDTESADRTWGADRWIQADSLTTDKYYFSCWVRSNHIIRIYCWCFAADTSLCTNGYKFFEFANLDSLNWQRVEGVFDLSDVDTNCLAWIKPELVLNDGPNGTEFAEFDDFRFHPIDVTVTSATFDDLTGSPLSESGASNYPLLTKYDEFMRPSSLIDFKGEILKRTEHYQQEVVNASDDSVVSVFESGTKTTNVHVNIGQTAVYVLEYDVQFIPPVTTNGYSKFSVNGSTVDSIGFSCVAPNHCAMTKIGYYDAQPDDILTIEVYASNLGANLIKAKVALDSLVYNLESPNYNKSVAYTNTSDSIVTISYLDGLGRATQIRNTSQYGNDTALVAGMREYDARGKVTKTYKPFLDLVGSTDIADYSTFDSALVEVNHYFSDSSDGPDCQGYPYSEKVYEKDFDSRLVESAMPGVIYSVNDTFTAIIEYEVDILNNLVKQISYDQDGIKRVSENDQWGLLARNYSFYARPDTTEDSIVTINSYDFLDNIRSVEIDTGGAQTIKLRETFYNDINQADSSWKVDHGTVRMLYDKAGNIRFVQDDKRKEENRFVYFKYDKLGRKIEEGRMEDDTLYFSQTYADSFNFPDTSYSPFIRYQWYFDSFDTIVAPGRLIRVESGDKSYYREFYYFPEDDSDLVLVNLQLAIDVIKGIKHEYNRDGSINYLTVYPHYPSASDKRKVQYLYNKAGQLRAIRSKDLLFGLDSLHYSEYEYNPDGSIKTASYGIRYINNIDTTYVDTAQKVDYLYNTLGELVAINSTDSVVSSYGLGVENGADNDHFAMEFAYFGSGSGFANGRVSQINTANSLATGKRSYSYNYNYNDLGWLVSAEDSVNSSNNRYYEYNALGNRVNVTFDTVTTTYEYATTAGSSRLVRTSDMPAGDSLYYDVLGNLIADSANKQYSMTYFENNLLYRVTLEPNLGPSATITTLTFYYNENQQRIMKEYLYYVWEECGGGGIPLGSQGLSGPGGGITSLAGPGEELCEEDRTTYTTYLYDNGVLLATFDGSDNVIDMFVNGPQGTVASYWQNDVNQLQYYFTDHLGSTRLTMSGQPSADTTFVSAWYNYHPFGELIESYETYSTPYQFTSKEYDNESNFGTYYFGARYYNAKLGRFNTIDKAGQFASGFLYAGNNPISIVDRDGNLATAIGNILYILAFSSAFLGASFAVIDVANALHYDGDVGEALFNAVWTAGMTYISFATPPSWAKVGIGLLPDPRSSDPWKDVKTSFAVTAGLMAIQYGAIEYDKWRYDGPGWYLQDDDWFKYLSKGDKREGDFVSVEFWTLVKSQGGDAVPSVVSPSQSVLDVSDLMNESTELINFEKEKYFSWNFMGKHFGAGKTFDYKRNVLTRFHLYYWDELTFLMRYDQPANFLAGYAAARYGYSLGATHILASAFQMGKDTRNFLISISQYNRGNDYWRDLLNFNRTIRDWPNNVIDQYYITSGHVRGAK